MSSNNINIEDPGGKTIIAERIEDGHVHLEIVDGGEITDRKVLEDSVLTDGHIHDGMVVEVTESGMLKPKPHDSAFREKKARDKVNKIGRRLED